MQRTYAAILFIIMLLNMPPFNQLGKIPFLMQHYQEHKQQNPQMTLGQFIRLHYMKCEAMANDNKEHSRLPFRTVDHVLPIVSLMPPVSHVIPEQFITASERVLSRYKTPFLPNPVVQHSYPPPKV